MGKKRLIMVSTIVVALLVVVFYIACDENPTCPPDVDQTTLETRGGVGITLRADSISGDSGLFKDHDPNDVLIGSFLDGSMTHGFISLGEPNTECKFSIGTASDWKFDTASFVPQFTIESQTGYVGIGTESPDNKLEVNGDVLVDSNLYISGNLDLAGDIVTSRNIFVTENIGLGTTQTRSNLHLEEKTLLVHKYGESDDPIVRIEKHSNVTYPNQIALEIKAGVIDTDPKKFWVGTADGDPWTLKAALEGNFYCTGNISAGGNCCSASDRRFKKNIDRISGSLEKVSQLSGINFDWDREKFPEKLFSDKRQIGLIAQDVQAVIPEVVTQDAEGYYYIAYNKLVPILIEAIKEQQMMIDELRKKVDEQGKD